MTKDSYNAAALSRSRGTMHYKTNCTG